MSDEYFDVFDASGNRIGQRLRRECHGNPALLHRAVHVAVFHPDGARLLLQKRKQCKDIQPGKWDTAVGGHLTPGEDWLSAACRELHEELGIAAAPDKLTPLFDLKIRNRIESEDVRVYKLVRSGGFTIQESELDAVRFWSFAELFIPENRLEFTPNLCVEIDRMAEEGVIRL
ncbi:MAG: NUDIX domain-containing protein [Victivallaceae bacterium]|nr:NUDIX domain-containing protein [Victivallaceae bacterium]